MSNMSLICRRTSSPERLVLGPCLCRHVPLTKSDKGNGKGNLLLVRLAMKKEEVRYGKTSREQRQAKSEDRGVSEMMKIMKKQRDA